MTTQGAVEFVRAYYDERSQVIQNNARYDKYLPQYMAPTCECRALLAFYERLTASGQELQGEPYKLTSASVSKLDGAQAEVAVTISSSAQQVVDNRGGVVRSAKAFNTRDLVTLTWQDNRWLVAATSSA